MSKTREPSQNLPSPSLKGPLLVSLAGIFWGTTGIVAKFVYLTGRITPFTLAFFRLAVAAVFLGLVWLGTRPGLKKREGIKGREGLLFIGFGLVVALFQLMYFQALRQTTATTAALLLTLTPVWVAVGSALFFREYPTPWTIGWGMVALVGMALLMGITQPETLKGGSFQGNLWALGASVCYAGYYFFSRTLLQNYRPLPVMAGAFTIGALLLCPLILTRQPAPQLSPQGWLGVVVLGVISTGIAGLFYLAGLRTTNTTLASLLGLVEPLTASFLGWLILREELLPVAWLGGVVLLLALAFMSAESLFHGNP